MTRIFAILILMAGFLAAPLLAGVDLITARAVLEDRTGALTLSQVIQSPFQPAEQTLAKGFSSSAYWLRLRVSPPVHGEEAVLFIRQPQLDDLRLYQATAGDPATWGVRVSGQHHPYRERDRPTSTLGFVLKVPAAGATYYLRLQTRTAVLMTTEVLERSEAEHLDHRFDLLEMFFVTAMGLLFLWAVQSFIQERLPVLGLFALYQAAYTLWGLSVTGYLAPFLPEDPSRLVYPLGGVFYCGVAFAWLLFCRELFKPYQPWRPLKLGMDLMLLVFPIELVAVALGHTFPAVILNGLMVRCQWWYFVLVAFSLRQEQIPRRRTLQFYFLAIPLLFSMVGLLGNSRAIGTNYPMFSRAILVANGVVVGSLFASILNARARRLLLEAREANLALQAKSEFLALVSHEIRTPLNTLVGFTALARKADTPTCLEEYLAILEETTHTLMALVNNILDLSKLEAGAMGFELLPLDLRQLMGTLEAQFGPLANAKGLAFRVELDGEVPPWVRADPMRIRQMLANLLANAVKFTERGSVTCSVRPAPAGREARRVQLSVRDTGIGIPEAARARLFQSFSQADPSIARKFGGTGLGLAIVHRLAALMGGTLSVTSHEGQGSCFTIELPMEPMDRPPEPAAPPPSGSALVVDDNAFNRRLLADLLGTLGHRTTLAESGPQALACLARERFNMVLVDIRMPGMDGLELARRIRALEYERSEPAVPILAVTADGDSPAIRAQALAAGINAMLAKPVLPEDLARTLAAHLGPAEAPLCLNQRTVADLAGDPGRARQYCELLSQDLEAALRDLEAALARQDHPEFSQAAHALKGLCAHLADPEPARLAGWLQENAAALPGPLRQSIGHLRASLHFAPTQAPPEAGV